MPTSFFHGVTVTLIDIGPRPIAIPSSSIIGLVDTYTPAEGLAEPNKPILLTSYREAVKQFGAGSALAKSARGIYAQSSAVVVAIGVPLVSDAAVLTSAIIGGVTVDGQRTGMQALLDGKSVHNAQPRLIICPGHSANRLPLALSSTCRTWPRRAPT